MENTLNANDFHFIKSNTQLNANSIFEFYKTFLSKYNNGHVNREEFTEILQRLVIVDESSFSSKAKSEQQRKLEAEKRKMCEILFDICDKDDNGLIDFKEYLVLFWSRANGTPHEKLSLIFDMFDLNGNDSIDFHEMHSIVRILFKLKYSQFDDDDDENNNNNNNTTSVLASSENNAAYEGSNYFLFNSTLPLTYHIAMNIMKKFDANRNGSLSKEEFISGCLAHANIKAFLTPLKVL
jgi:Ca2+-binding EF-hand superfamily protein